MTRLRAGAATDAGMVRAQNEDNLLMAEPLFAVADGMGGHAAGEVASETAIETLRVAFGRNPSLDGLVEAIQEANRRVWQLGQEDPARRGMGTTLTAAALVPDGDDETLAIANVGDSRVYLLRDGDLSQVTDDHSLVEELVRRGQLSAEEALVHPQKHVVTRVLGMGPDVEVDMFPVTPYRRDRVLLASDGLFNEVTDDEIAAVLRRGGDPEAVARELVERAKTAGGSDNITVVVVDVVDDDGRSEQASAALSAEPRTSSVPLRPSAPEGGAVERDDPSPRPVAAPAAAPARPTSAEPSHRRITARVVGFLLVFLLLLGGAVAAIAAYARGSYFVGVQGQQVVIFKGHPGGLLWFHPTVEQRTGLTTADMPESSVMDLNDGHVEPSVSAARRFVDHLAEEAAAARGATTTTTAPPPATTPTTAAPAP